MSSDSSTPSNLAAPIVDESGFSTGPPSDLFTFLRADKSGRYDSLGSPIPNPPNAPTCETTTDSFSYSTPPLFSSEDELFHSVIAENAAQDAAQDVDGREMSLRDLIAMLNDMDPENINSIEPCPNATSDVVALDINVDTDQPGVYTVIDSLAHPCETPMEQQHVECPCPLPAVEKTTAVRRQEVVRKSERVARSRSRRAMARSLSNRCPVPSPQRTSKDRLPKRGKREFSKKMGPSHLTSSSSSSSSSFSLSGRRGRLARRLESAGSEKSAESPDRDSAQLVLPGECPDVALEPLWRVLREWVETDGTDGSVQSVTAPTELPDLGRGITLNVLSRALAVDLHSSEARVFVPEAIIPSPPSRGQVYHGSGYRQSLVDDPQVREAAAEFHANPKSASVYLEEYGMPVEQLERLVEEFMVQPLSRVSYGYGGPKLSPRDKRLCELCALRGPGSSEGGLSRSAVPTCLPHVAHAMRDGRVSLALPHLTELVRVCRRYDHPQKTYLLAALRRAFVPFVFPGAAVDPTAASASGDHPVLVGARRIARATRELEAAAKEPPAATPEKLSSSALLRHTRTCIVAAADLMAALTAIDCPPVTINPAKRRPDLYQALSRAPKTVFTWERAMRYCAASLWSRLVIGSLPLPSTDDVTLLVEAMEAAVGVLGCSDEGDVRPSIAYAASGWRMIATMLGDDSAPGSEHVTDDCPADDDTHHHDRRKRRGGRRSTCRYDLPPGTPDRAAHLLLYGSPGGGNGAEPSAAQESPANPWPRAPPCDEQEPLSVSPYGPEPDRPPDDDFETRKGLKRKSSEDHADPIPEGNATKKTCGLQGLPDSLPPAVPETDRDNLLLSPCPITPEGPPCPPREEPQQPQEPQEPQSPSFHISEIGEALFHSTPISPTILFAPEGFIPNQGDVYRPHGKNLGVALSAGEPYVPAHRARPALERLANYLRGLSSGPAGSYSATGPADWLPAFARDPVALGEFCKRISPVNRGGRCVLEERLSWTLRHPADKIYDLIILVSERAPGEFLERAYAYAALCGRACMPGGACWPESWTRGEYPYIPPDEKDPGRSVAILCTTDLGYAGAVEWMLERALSTSGRACVVVDARDPGDEDSRSGPRIPTGRRGVVYARTSPPSHAYLVKLFTGPAAERLERGGLNVGHVVMDRRLTVSWPLSVGKTDNDDEGTGDREKCPPVKHPFLTHVTLRRLRDVARAMDAGWSHSEIGKASAVLYPYMAQPHVGAGAMPPCPDLSESSSTMHSSSSSSSSSCSSSSSSSDSSSSEEDGDEKNEKEDRERAGGGKRRGRQRLLIRDRVYRGRDYRVRTPCADIVGGTSASFRAVAAWGRDTVIPALPLAASWSDPSKIPQEVLRIISDYYPDAPGARARRNPLHVEGLALMRARNPAPLALLLGDDYSHYHTPRNRSPMCCCWSAPRGATPESPRCTGHTRTRRPRLSVSSGRGETRTLVPRLDSSEDRRSRQRHRRMTNYPLPHPTVTDPWW